MVFVWNFGRDFALFFKENVLAPVPFCTTHSTAVYMRVSPPVIYYAVLQGIANLSASFAGGTLLARYFQKKGILPVNPFEKKS